MTKILLPLDPDAVEPIVLTQFPFRGLPRERSLTVRMDITNNCNLRCIHCTLSQNRAFRGETASYMATEDFKRIADQVFHYAHTVALSCEAEPTLHPDFEGILGVVDASRGPNYKLTTHGMLLNEATIIRMIDCGIGSINLSMDGARKETFERIRQRGNFSKIIETLELIDRLKTARGLTRSEDPVVQVNFTLMRSTINELPEMVELCAKYGVFCLTTQHLYCLEQNGLESESLSAEMQNAEAVLKVCAESCRAVGILPRFPASSSGPTDESSVEPSEIQLTCEAPWRMLRIRWNGDVHPCDLWGDEEPLGNLMQSSFEEIWNGYEFTRLRWDHARRSPTHPRCIGCTMVTTDNLEGKKTLKPFVLTPELSPSKT